MFSYRRIRSNGGLKGGGLPNFTTAIESLDEIFRSVGTSTANQFESLFGLQELSRIALSLNHFAIVLKASNQAPNSANILFQRSHQLASAVLRRVYDILNSEPYYQFETRGPSRPYLKALLLAHVNRGPPRLDKYFFLYGLLDCAAQVARILPPLMMEPDFGERMMQIIRLSSEPSYRWKAVEILLSAPDTRKQQCGIISEKFAPSVESLLTELPVILYDVLNQKEKVVLPEPSSSQTEETTVLRPTKWEEAPFPVLQLSPIEKDVKTNVANRKRFSKNFISAGLSPDCGTAFFLRPDSVMVQSLGKEKQVPFRPSITREWDLDHAALSQSYLALLTKRDLTVFDHKSRSWVGDKTFGTDKGEEPWNSSCIAIHEAGDRVWIAVGGVQSQKESTAMRGSIRMYRIVYTADGTALQRHDAAFQSDVFNSEYLKRVAFDPKGTRIVGVTQKSKVLAFFLSNNARPKDSSFCIVKDYKTVSQCLSVFGY